MMRGIVLCVVLFAWSAACLAGVSDGGGMVGTYANYGGGNYAYTERTNYTVTVGGQTWQTSVIRSWGGTSVGPTGIPATPYYHTGPGSLSAPEIPPAWAASVWNEYLAHPSRAGYVLDAKTGRYIKATPGHLFIQDEAGNIVEVYVNADGKLHFRASGPAYPGGEDAIAGSARAAWMAYQIGAPSLSMMGDVSVAAFNQHTASAASAQSGGALGHDVLGVGLGYKSGQDYDTRNPYETAPLPGSEYGDEGSDGESGGWGSTTQPALPVATNFPKINAAIASMNSKMQTFMPRSMGVGQGVFPVWTASIMGHSYSFNLGPSGGMLAAVVMVRQVCAWCLDLGLVFMVFTVMRQY